MAMTDTEKKLYSRLSDLFDDTCEKINDIQLNLDYDIEDREFRRNVFIWFGEEAWDGYIDWREETFA